MLAHPWLVLLRWTPVVLRLIQVGLQMLEHPWLRNHTHKRGSHSL
jgi:hypothetical protein